MIAAIELAVLARLKALEEPLGFAWRRLLTLPDDWESYLTEKKGEIVGPIAWIAFTGWSDADRVDTADGEQLEVTGTFALLVGNTSKRPDEAANRHGGPNAAIEPGSYRLALGAAAALSGQMLGLDLVSPIEVGNCQPLPRSKAMADLFLSIHGLVLSCRFPIAIVGEGDPEQLLALHANWDIPLLGAPVPIDADPVAPGVQLPDDDHADATDHLDLETQE